jgi:hypothetical protein
LLVPAYEGAERNAGGEADDATFANLIQKFA